MALKEMESGEEPTTGGKPTYIELPQRRESPGHRVPDMGDVPFCEVAMPCDITDLQACRPAMRNNYVARQHHVM